MKTNPKELLDTMLGHLDFSFEIKEFESPKGLTLQVYSPERERLLGRRGEIEPLRRLIRHLETVLKRTLHKARLNEGSNAISNVAKVRVDPALVRDFVDCGVVDRPLYKDCL